LSSEVNVEYDGSDAQERKTGTAPGYTRETTPVSMVSSLWRRFSVITVRQRLRTSARAMGSYLN